jgi:hypothetical protein
MSWMVAEMAVVTNIAPSDLLDTEPEVFWSMVSILERRAIEAERSRRGR